MKVPTKYWALAVAALLLASPVLAEDEPNPDEAPSKSAASDTDEDPEPGAEDDEYADDEPEQDEDDEYADDEYGPDDDVEEIIVEGTTGETKLEVPTSVTTFSGSDLQELRIQDIADLSEFTPNLEINTAFAASNPTLFIRGIGLKDYNANSATAVAVYQDGILMNSPAGQLFTMFDVQSVEILRGPQGSLNGRNATAGAILVESVKPDGEWSSTGSFTYGNYNDIELEGALGFPIVDEMLSGRLAFTFQQRDGLVKNRCSGWSPKEEGFVDQPVGNPNNPRGIRTYDFSGETLREEYFKDVDAGNPPTDPDGPALLYNLQRTDNNQRQRAMNLAGTGATAFRLTLDNVCHVEEPGDIVTAAGEAAGALPPGDPDYSAKTAGLKEGDLIENPTYVSLNELSGLRERTNNADNWAARGMLRAQPIAGMDLLFNAHGGMNRSDSFHLQMVGAEPRGLPSDPDDPNPPVITDPSYGESLNSATNPWSEVRASELLEGAGSPWFEEITELDGLEPELLSTNPVGRGGAEPFLGWYNRDGKEKLDVMGFSLTARQEFDAPHWWVPSLITSITGYEWNERTVGVDGDGSPTNILLADYYDTTWQVSEELRIEGEGERLWWILGGFFLYEELESSNQFPSTIGRDMTQNFLQELTSYAGFFHGRYDFTDHLLDLGVPDLLAGWSLEGGARYNSEEKTFDLESTIVVLETGESAGQLQGGDANTWTGWTGDVTIAYAPVEEATIYTKFSHGLKSGHFNAGLTINPGRCEEETDEGCQTITAVDPEYIDALEVGAKMNAFDGRLKLSAAWFRYWYSGLQVFDIVNEQGTVPTQQLLNSDADVMGVELELQVHPFSGLFDDYDWLADGFFIQFGGGWLDSEFIDFSVTKSRVLSRTGRRITDTYVYDGNPLIAAPEWNFSGLVEWEIPISRWGSIVPSYNFSYRSRVAVDPTNDEMLSQPGYWLHNARLAYRTPDGRIEIAGWVRNFMDEQYRVDVFDLTLEFQSFLQVWGDPRMYGLNISYMW